MGQRMASALPGPGRACCSPNGIWTLLLVVSLSMMPGLVAVAAAGTLLDTSRPFAPGAVVQETNGEQVHWTSSSMVGNFYFDPSQDQAAARKPAPVLKPGPEAEQEHAVVKYDPVQERSLWERIKDSRNAVDFKAYLERFSSAPRAAYARWMVQKYGAGSPTEVASLAPTQNPIVVPSAPALPSRIDPAPAAAPSGTIPLSFVPVTLPHWDGVTDE